MSAHRGGITEADLQRRQHAGIAERSCRGGARESQRMNTRELQRGNTQENSKGETRSGITKYRGDARETYSTLCPNLSSLLILKDRNHLKNTSNRQKPSYKKQKVKIYFGASHFEHKHRCKPLKSSRKRGFHGQ